MAHVQTQTPDRPDEDKPMRLYRTTDTAKSNAHVSQLISIGNHSMQLLAVPDNLEDKIAVEPEAVKTALETFQLVHTRLRDLVDEQRRWSLEPSPDEKAHDALVSSTLKLYDSKTAAANIANRPCVFLRAKIARFNVGWIAWVGDELPLKNSLHGVGASPALALDAFDAVYRTEEKIADDQPGAPPPAPPAPTKPPRRKKP